MNDVRNVQDRYKGWPIEHIIADLDTHGSPLEIAIENTLRDFNMGSIVRSANAFGVRHIHIIGRKQWNKRGAMATEKYIHLHYYTDFRRFIAAMQTQKKHMIAIENNVESEDIRTYRFPVSSVLIFGQEGPGISQPLLQAAEVILSIPQIGSTRSINVGAAAAIALYEYNRQFHLA